MSANDETAWEPEEPVGGSEINGTERCWSKSPGRGKEQRVRRWQRPREETTPVKEIERERRRGTRPRSSAQFICDSRDERTDKEKTNSDQPTPIEQRVMVPPEIPHDTRICIEDLVDPDFEESDVDEWRDEREVQDDRTDIQHAEFVHRGRWNAQARSSAAAWVTEASKSLERNFQGLRMESEEDPDGEVLTMDEWTQLCVEVDRLEGAMEHEMEGSSSACVQGCRH